VGGYVAEAGGFLGGSVSGQRGGRVVENQGISGKRSGLDRKGRENKQDKTAHSYWKNTR
jgi:hypothetical protein